MSNKTYFLIFSHWYNQVGFEIILSLTQKIQHNIPNIWLSTFFFNVHKVYDLVLFEFFFKQKILTSNTFTVDLQIKKKMVKNYKMLLQSKLIYTYLWNISKTRTSNQVLQFTQVKYLSFAISTYIGICFQFNCNVVTISDIPVLR